MTQNNLLQKTKTSPLQEKEWLDPLAALQKDFSRILDETINNNNEIFSLWNKGITISPSVDIIENGKLFKIKAEFPGIEAENVSASIEDGCLVLKGEKEEEKEEKNDKHVRRECSYGSYQRSVKLPEGADSDTAKASFKNSVLKIEIPKKPEAVSKKHKLEIKKEA